MGTAAYFGTAALPARNPDCANSRFDGASMPSTGNAIPHPAAAKAGGRPKTVFFQALAESRVLVPTSCPAVPFRLTQRPRDSLL